MSDFFRRLAKDSRVRAESHENEDTRATLLAVASTYESMVEGAERAQQAGMRLENSISRAA